MPGNTNSGRRPGFHNPTAGRKASSKRLKLGDQFYAVRETPGGITAGELWTVEQVSRKGLVFRCGEEVIKLVS